MFTTEETNPAWSASRITPDGILTGSSGSWEPLSTEIGGGGVITSVIDPRLLVTASGTCSGDTCTSNLADCTEEADRSAALIAELERSTPAAIVLM